VNYGYEIEYPNEVVIEFVNKDESVIRFYTGIDEFFQITSTREYSPANVTYYLDTPARGNRMVGENLWSEHVLPDGYCDAVGCTESIYALQMEEGDVLYNATFYAQNDLTELQLQIISSFRVK
jgi:hypothetical protein